MAAARILLVEDEVNMARTLAKNLERAGYEVEHAPQGEAALARLGETAFDVVLTDLTMPVMDGMALLHAIHDRGISTSTVVLTGYGTIESAVEAMKLGAADYLIKDARPQEILLTLERVLQVASLRRENARLRREIGRLHGFGEIIGHSAPMAEVYRLIDAVSQNKSTVLLTGESGTGKELVARSIHARSSRSSRRFVAVNCGALPENLIESELFGHVRGAFTGAVAAKRGLFEEATGGTLFLDEVGELPLVVQVKLTRALQERSVRRVGGTTEQAVDVRVIAATNVDLAAAVEAGRFREDLYYRLDVLTIRLPPLRERQADIPLLAEGLLARISSVSTGPPRKLSPEALALLASHDWPGNVRQLENALARAVAVSPDEVLGPESLPPEIGRAGPSHRSPLTSLPYRKAIAVERDRATREYLVALLREAQGNVTQAAERAGIERESFHRLMKRCGVRAEDYRAK